MQQISKTIRLATTLALLILIACRSALAADTVSCDKRLPGSTLLYASIGNITQFKGRFAKSLIGKMIDDPALGEFRAEVEKLIDEFAKELAIETDFSLKDFLSIPEGEIAVAAFPTGDGEIHGVFMIDFGSQGEVLHRLLDKLAETSDKQNLSRSEDDAEGAKIITYREKGGDADEGQSSASYFVKDSFFVVGDHPSALKEVLRRWEGKEDDPLSENANYLYILQKCHDEHADLGGLISWYIDPVSFVKMMAESHPGALGPAGGFSALLPTFGFDQLKGIGGVFQLGHGDFDLVNSVFFMLEPSPQGFGNLFQFDPIDQTPPKWLSADWTSYTALNWNVAKAYATAEQLTDMLLGPGAMAAQIDRLAENAAFGNIHLKKDVIDQLTGEFHFLELEPADGGKTAHGSMVAIQVRKAAAAKALLTKVAGLGLIKLEEREFQGETIYEFDNPMAGLLPVEEELPKMGLVVTEGRVIYVSDVRLIERILRGVGDSETLADSAAYKKVARFLPPKTAMLNFSRQDSQLSALFEVLKESPASMLFGVDDLDFSKLPDADLLKKYFPPTGGYLVRDPKGYKLVEFGLKGDAE